MPTRRGFGACALCAALGLVASRAGAQSERAQTSGVTRSILQKTEFPGDRYATILMAVEIAPGATVARHTHPGVESAYVLDGGGELKVQGQPDRTVKAKDGFQIPAGVPHSFQGGQQPTRLVITYVVEKDKPLASPAPG